MNRSNKLIYNKSDYRDVEDFYQVIFKQIRVLLDTHQLFSFHENPKIRGMYVLQFGPNEITDDATFPVWLDAEEIASVSAYSQLRDYQDAKEYIEKFETSMKETKDALTSFDEIDDIFGNPKPKKKKDNGGNNDA